MPIPAPQSASRTFVRSFRSTTGLRGDCGDWAARTFTRGAGADTLTTGWRLVAAGQRHTRLNGPQLLTELKTVALGPLGLGHSNNEVSAPARKALAFINQELDSVIWPDHTIFGSKPPSGQAADIGAVRAVVNAHRDFACPAPWLSVIETAARGSDPVVRQAARETLAEFVRLGLVDSSKLPSDNRDKVEAALKRAVPSQTNAADYRAALALRDELNRLAGDDPGLKALIKDKVTELQAFMDRIKPSLPDVVLIEKPLQVEVGAASFDSYEIVDYIGQGGMADVVLARKVGTEELYAVKILMEPMLFLRNDFVEEGKKIGEEFHHPNIVKGYGQGHVLIGHKDRPFIVMEHLPTALDKPVAKTAGNGKTPVFFTLKLEQKLAVARAVAEALNYAWKLPGPAGKELNYVHRDIKLGNILIKLGADGELLEIKLGDFGLARALAKLDPETATRTGEIKGTPMYQAPELATLNVARGGDGGQKRVDKVNDAGPLPDIYSLGITLYALLAHRFPPERDLKGLAKSHGTTINDEYARFALALATGQGREAYELKDKPESIPEPVWQLILKMTAIDPADRCQTYDEVIAALDGCTRTHDSLASKITAVFSGDPDKTSVFSFSAADAPRLAGLVPEKAYTINKSGLEQARKDLAMINWLIDTLVKAEPANKYLPALKLNATAVDFWIRLKTPEIDPEATVQRLSSEELLGTATVIAEAGALLADAMPTGHVARLEFAKTQLQLLAPVFEEEKPAVVQPIIVSNQTDQTLVVTDFLPQGVVIVSSKGGRRNNEDHGAAKTELDAQGNMIVTLGTFDGMGGHAKGEVASRMAAETVFATAGTLGQAIAAANAKLDAESALTSAQGVNRMGTTAALFRVNSSNGESAVLAVGDSRPYLLRREGALFLLQLPQNSVLTSMREDPKRVDTFIPLLYDDLGRDPDKSKLEAKIAAFKTLLIVRPPYIEAETDLINELLVRVEKHPGVLNQLVNPAFVLGHKLPPTLEEDSPILRAGDTAFVCSDGVKLPARRIREIFQAEPSLDGALKLLVEESFKMNGAKSDNITAVGYRQLDVAALLSGQIAHLRRSLADAQKHLIELARQAG